MSKRLPVLKILLFPVACGVLYSAFCYYREQYEAKTHKMHAPIRYMQKLLDLLQQTQSAKELLRVYNLMDKNMNEFVIDPSRKSQKMIDSNVQRQVGEYAGISSRIKINKDYEINFFNGRKQKKDGLFSLGIWTQLNEVQINTLHLANSMIKISEKAIKLRQKKCKNIADIASRNLQRGYLQEYIQCMSTTNDYVADLFRKVEIAKKILKYQLV